MYSNEPSGLPDPTAVSKSLGQTAVELLSLRASPLVPDYTGPVLFDPSAAGSALAQVLEPSLSGAREPLSMTAQDFDAFIERFGGRSEWTGRVGTRVLARQRHAGG